MSKEFEEDELTAITELKRRLKEMLEKDSYGDENLFYRFLKAQGFNVDKAEMMLKEHLKWREKYDVKNISKIKHPEVVEKYFNFHKLGHDKEGAVIRYVPSGKTDWIGLYDSITFEDFIKILIHYFEEDMEDAKSYCKEGIRSVRKVTFIHNMEHFTLAQATSRKVIFNSISLIHLYLNNYPEVLKAIYIINASMYFHFLFSVLQKFLPASILSKIKLYSDDSYKEDLLKSIDAEVLPAFLGGKRTDPDGNPLCLTFINHGEPVPAKYYIHRSKRSLANDPEVQHLTLSRASFHEIFLEVKERDCYLEWEFETENRDIGFGLFYEDKKRNKTEIIPIQRINTEEFSETGMFKCENVGTYIVVFDNTYSVLRKKDLYYKIKVVKQNEEDSYAMN